MTRQSQRSPESIRSIAAARVKVAQLLARKTQGVWTVAADASTYDAIHIMVERSVGALPVVEAGQVVGIISERDCARRLILAGKSPLGTSVREVMSTNLLTITEQSTIEDCMSLMTDHKIRHLPVMQDGALLGIVSIGDLVYEIIMQQQQTLDELERYVAG